MASLTFVDNANNTGGVFTIAGSTATATNTVYVSRFTGNNTQRPFVPAGSIVGNGSLAFAGTQGPFLAVLSSVDGVVVSVANPLGFRITDGQPSLHERCAIAIRDFVLNLALPLLPSNGDLHIVTKLGAKLDAVLEMEVPKSKVCVYYVPTRENYTWSDSQDDMVRYPVQVIILSQDGHSLVKDFSDLLFVRERMHRGLNSSTLLDLPEIAYTEVQPGVIVDPGRWVANFNASVMTFICHTVQHSGVV